MTTMRFAVHAKNALKQYCCRATSWTQYARALTTTTTMTTTTTSLNDSMWGKFAHRGNTITTCNAAVEVHKQHYHGNGSPWNGHVDMRAGGGNAPLHAAHDGIRDGLRAELVPVVLEQTKGGERAYDIFSRLLKERIICVNGPITDGTAASVVAQLIWLESQAPTKPIYMYINSPGGQVTSGLAIYDTMQYVRCPISTLCMGQAMSMASLLLAAGDAGMRKCLPSARIMLHQPSGGASGQVENIAIHAAELVKVRARLNDIYMEHTGQDTSTIEDVMDRDRFFSPEEAKAFGLLDEVITRRKKTAEDGTGTTTTEETG